MSPEFREIAEFACCFFVNVAQLTFWTYKRCVENGKLRKDRPALFDKKGLPHERNKTTPPGGGAVDKRAKPGYSKYKGCPQQDGSPTLVKK